MLKLPEVHDNFMEKEVNVLNSDHPNRFYANKYL